MKFITLTQNKKAIVDNDDYPFLVRFKWCAHKTRNGLWYVEHKVKGSSKMISMHRLILGLIYPSSIEVDHINRNGLDNRKKNIKICYRSENLRNRKRFKNRKTFGGHKGIYKTNSKKYICLVFIEKKTKLLGTFKTKKEAKKRQIDYYKKYLLNKL